MLYDCMLLGLYLTGESQVKYNTNTMQRVITQQVEDEQKYASIGAATIDNKSRRNKLQREHIVKVQPRAIPPATTLQGGVNEIQFDLPNSVDEIDKLFLSFVVTNTDAVNALDLVDTFSMIEFVEIICNSDVVQTLWGQAMRANWLATTSSEKLTLAALGAKLNHVNPGLSLFSVPASGTTTVFMPIDSILNTTSMPLWFDKVHWRINIRFRSGSDVLMTTSAAAITAASMSSVELIVDGLLYHENVRAALHSEIVHRPQLYKYQNQQRDVLSLGPVTNGTVTQQNWAASGALSHAWLQLASTTATNESSFLGSAVTSFELLRDGIPVHGAGDNGYTYALQKACIAASHWTNPYFLNNINLPYLCFNDSPEKALSNHGNDGFYVVNNNTVIRLKPGATIASAKLSVYGHFAAAVLIDFAAGKASISKNIF